MRYLKTVLISLLISYIIFILLVLNQISAPTESSRWIYEVYTIKSRLASLSPNPKLLLVSGSNALFGISCQTIQQETKVPCVNTAVQAGLGIDYILNHARSFAKPGDTILVPLEYGLYTLDDTPTDVLIDYVFARDPKYLLSVNAIAKVRLIGGMSFTRLARGISAKFQVPKQKNSGYQSKNINNYGDETSNSEAKITDVEQRKVNEQIPISLRGKLASDSAAFKTLREFANWCKSNKIQLIATWPNTIWFDVYKKPIYQDFFQDIKKFYTSIDVPIVGKHDDFMYAKNMFYDTNYHLNDKGVRYHTKQVINLLQPYLKNMSVL